MSDPVIGIISVGLLLALVLTGIPIGFSLLVASLVGLVALTGSLDQTLVLLSNTALGGVRNYVFVVIPLFILMGAFMSNSPTAKYLYDLARVGTKRLVGGLATATVIANGFFGTVTGISVASAAIFARISVPEMVKRGYSLRLALGSVAGSSVLGMLLPPSLLMILYGILAGVSIGKLFIAGIVPALVLIVLYVVLITVMGLIKPASVGKVDPAAGAKAQTHQLGDLLGDSHDSGTVNTAEPSTTKLLLRAVPIVVLMAIVLGGIWTGWFTPTEASAIGAFGALLVAVGFGMRRQGFKNSFRETGKTLGSIMLLLVAATLFSRMLAQSGLVSELTVWIGMLGASPVVIVLLFVLLLLLMGAILDSTSILLIMVPLMAPVITTLEMDPIWFAIIVIVAIEVGLLTPPFGISPFAMSSVLGPKVKVTEIFIGALPFAAMMVVLIFLLIMFPGLVTWLPNLMG